MNRFRWKKETREGADGVGTPSTDSDAPSMPPVKSKTFRLGRKTQPGPKPELDLSTALPSSDEFRTSLLMSGLSARFSMLRELDDPSSKIGKASDDSVLYPKRQSRLNTEGFISYGLSDIAEVASLNGSIRPPFAVERAASHGSRASDANDDDLMHSRSVMNRAKPGEGNILFGGRQKINMGGRTLYEPDVCQSAFQKIRARERQQLRLESEELAPKASTSDSPPLSGYNRNRETSSTMSSAGSSDATSVTSLQTPSVTGTSIPVSLSANDGLGKKVMKTRRLYETGLDNHLHEQQFSAMSRIDTLTRQRTTGNQTPPTGLSPTSVAPTSLSPLERWAAQPMGSKCGTSIPRSPASVTSTGGFEFKTALIDTKSYGMASPPLSPPASVNEEMPVLNFQPNDRGKGTAVGAFVKPLQYDEKRYSQRQVQMQQGRGTPSPRKNSAPQIILPSCQPSVVRNRAESNSTYGSNRSSSTSLAQRNMLPERWTESPRIQEAQIIRDSTVEPFPASPSQHSSDFSTDPRSNHRMRASPKPLDPSNLNRSLQQMKRPLISQHPINREQPFELQPRNGTSSVISPLADLNPAKNSEYDPPTLEPRTESVGMGPHHLRSDSSASSVYGGVPSVIYPMITPLAGADFSGQYEYFSGANPWEDDDWDQEPIRDDAVDLPSDQVSPSLSVQFPNFHTLVEEPHQNSWERQFEETRCAPPKITDTQREALALKNELASRRKQVQDKLKTFAEADSMSASPVPSPSEIPKESLGKNNGFGILRNKTSRGSVAVRPRDGGPSKTKRMLGIGNTTTSPRSPSECSSNQEDEDEVSGSVPRPLTPSGTRMFQQTRQEAQRNQDHQLSGGFAETEFRAENQRQRQLSHTSWNRRRTPSCERKLPVSYVQRNGSSTGERKGSLVTNYSDSRPASARDRSGSEASGGLSGTRIANYRNDVSKDMEESLSATNQISMEDPHRLTSKVAIANAPYQPSIPAAVVPDSRSRSSSRSNPTGHSEYNFSVDPRFSTNTPASVNANPPLVQATSASGAVPPAIFVQHKRPTNKPMISDPSLFSSTSRVTAISAAFESSVAVSSTRNHPPPPIPPVNPRRRQTRVMYGLSHRSEESDVNLLHVTGSEDRMSMFEIADDAHGNGRKSSLPYNLKGSSEGGNFNIRSRNVMPDEMHTMPVALTSFTRDGGMI